VNPNLDPLFDLNGRVVAVTGGLGRLGQAFTGCLLERGAKLAILDIATTNQALSKPVAEAKAQGRLVVIESDVTDRASLERALAKVEDLWEPPHGLINNAAIDAPPNATAEENGPFETYPRASLDRILDVNVTGVLQACQVFGGRMAELGRGSIVNVSSIYGLVAPDQRLYQYRRERGEAFFKPVGYSLSKSALFNLTRYLATYWAGKGVRVNTVTFGGVFDNQDPAFLKEYQARVPLGRMARADEYNGTIVYLLSDASAYMTGSNVIIDGGWTAW
jgi:NAD(P)-dependent dehydrogenase (short-subunit alcohol dehydrogenase family)